MVELILIRHGEAKRRQGESYLTAPLTDLGRRQAQLTGEYLVQNSVRLDGYYSSPLRRARETAAVIGQVIGLEPEIRDGLQEMRYREFPGIFLLELVARLGVFDRYFEANIGKPLCWSFVGRVTRTMTRILAEHPTGQVGVVAHGGVISSVLVWYFPRTRARWWRETVENCSVTRLEVKGRTAQLISFNETGHLGEARG